MATDETDPEVIRYASNCGTLFAQKEVFGMKCEDVLGLFSVFYDKETECADEISAHLKKCPACALEYKNFCKIIKEIRKLPAPQLPSGFHDELMQGVIRSVDNMRKQRKKRVFYRQFALAAAASVLIAFVWLSGVLNFDRRDFGEPLNYSDVIHMVESVAETEETGSFYDNLTPQAEVFLYEDAVMPASLPDDFVFDTGQPMLREGSLVGDQQQEVMQKYFISEPQMWHLWDAPVSVDVFPKASTVEDESRVLAERRGFGREPHVGSDDFVFRFEEFEPVFGVAQSDEPLLLGERLILSDVSDCPQQVSESQSVSAYGIAVVMFILISTVTVTIIMMVKKRKGE